MNTENEYKNLVSLNKLYSTSVNIIFWVLCISSYNWINPQRPPENAVVLVWLIWLPGLIPDHNPLPTDLFTCCSRRAALNMCYFVMMFSYKFLQNQLKHWCWVDGVSPSPQTLNKTWCSDSVGRWHRRSSQFHRSVGNKPPELVQLPVLYICCLDNILPGLPHPY